MRGEIADKLYGTGSREKSRRMDLVLGYPGAGKSAALVSRIIDKLGSILIDADAVKEKLPEYLEHGGERASQLHEESSDIAEGLLLYKAASNGDNIVMPLVGKNENKLRGLIELFKRYNYSVYVHFVDVSQKVAIDRVIYRYRGGRRFVDPDYIQKIPDGHLKAIFHRIVRESNANGYTEWSNEVPPGDPPRLLGHSGDDDALAWTR